MTTAWDSMLDRLLGYASGALSRHRLLLAHLDYAWDLARPKLDGMTDEEYFWEPAPDCWSVRPQDDGTFMADWVLPEPSPPPFTTAAWRTAHIGFLLHMRANHYFGDRSLTALNAPWPGTAQAALEWIDGGFNAYRNGVASLDDADLDQHPDGPPGYLDTKFPVAMAIQHLTLEITHHGAEVSVLRDLYRARSARR